MLTLTREKLLAALAQIPALVNRYQHREPDFAARVVSWLDESEQQLTPLRHPLVSFIAARRGLVLGTAEGALDEACGRGTRRRNTAGRALTALSEVDEACRGEIARIDRQFDEWRDKLVQLLAVASSRSAIPLPDSGPRNVWLQRVWHQLGEGEETLGMYNYLNAAVATSDRLHLLDEVLDRLLAGQAAPPLRNEIPPEPPGTTARRPSRSRRTRRDS
jgi:hypothetical protein